MTITNSNELIDPEGAEKLHAATARLIEVAAEMVEVIGKALKRAFKIIFDFFLSIGKTILPKSYYLAHHARKQRVRKKHRRRLWCEINRILR